MCLSMLDTKSYVEKYPQNVPEVKSAAQVVGILIYCQLLVYWVFELFWPGVIMDVALEYMSDEESAEMKTIKQYGTEIGRSASTRQSIENLSCKRLKAPCPFVER